MRADTPQRDGRPGGFSARARRTWLRRAATHAADRVLEFRARLDVFALLRAGALIEGTVSNWRFDNGLLLRLTFQAPNLTVEHGSQRQQGTAPTHRLSGRAFIVRHVTEAATRFTKSAGSSRVGYADNWTMAVVTSRRS
jgi:hypothetical protein